MASERTETPGLALSLRLTEALLIRLRARTGRELPAGGLGAALLAVWLVSAIASTGLLLGAAVLHWAPAAVIQVPLLVLAGWTALAGYGLLLILLPRAGFLAVSRLPWLAKRLNRYAGRYAGRRAGSRG